jgi:tetratricopeptide (TPR) repeat protein
MRAALAKCTASVLAAWFGFSGAATAQEPQSIPQLFSPVIKGLDDRLKRNPQDAEAYFHRGLTEQVLGLHKEAIDDFSNASSICPNRPEVYVCRAASYGALGNLELMEADWNKALEVNPNGTISLNSGVRLDGRVQFEELDLGEPDLLAVDYGPVGSKFVRLAEHMYLDGETSPSLSPQPEAVRKDYERRACDHRDLGGWYAWCPKILHALCGGWLGDVPGTCHCLIVVDSEGHMDIQPRDFAPAVDRNNKFASPNADPNIEEKFFQTLSTLSERLSNSSALAFPMNSTAKRAVLPVGFTSDHDLSVCIPDLTVFQNIPKDEKNLRIARLCAILEAGYQYQLSDHICHRLPPVARQRFVPESCRHSLSYHWPDACGSYILADWRSKPIDPSVIAYVQMELDKYLDAGKYYEAEVLAKELFCAYLLWLEDDPRRFPAITVEMMKEKVAKIPDKVQRPLQIDELSRLARLRADHGDWQIAGTLVQAAIKCGGKLDVALIADLKRHNIDVTGP